MPELPEVETVRRGLSPCLDQSQIKSVCLRRAGLRFPFPPAFSEALGGQRTGRLRRRAKYLLLPLESGQTLLVHLGMSGRFRIESPDSPPQTPERHDHVILTLGGGIRLVFNDVRRFGFMEVWSHINTCPRLQGLGPEPLSKAFDAAFLGRKLKARTAPIKAVLLDQSVGAGLGNIYVCEALFAARIHPARAASQLTDAETIRLALSVKSVLRQAIKAGGTSLRDHARPDGTLGYFQNRLSVYARHKQACLSCGESICRIVQSGRSSFFCPACQTFSA